MRKSRREVYDSFINGMDMSVLNDHEPARAQLASFIQRHDKDVRMIVGCMIGAMFGWAVKKTYRMIRKRLA